MNVTSESTAVNRVKLTITVDPAAFEAGMHKAYLKIRGTMNVPGFRKGKVPRKIIENMYSEAAFYEEAVDIILPEVYPQAVVLSGIHPVDRPEFDIVQIGTGKDLILTAEVTVKPEVVLGAYKGIEVEKPEYNVTAEDVDAEVEKARERVARWIVIEDRPVQNGDRVLLDYAGFADGEQFKGGTAQNQTLDIGSGSFIPGFEEQIVGMNSGEEKEIHITFPEVYHSEELKGKPAMFQVKIHEIKAKELPILDDAFAQDVSEFDTLQAYRDSIEKRLTDAAIQKTEQELVDRMIAKVVENVTVEIPDCMVEHQIDNMLKDMEYRMSYQGIRMEDYLRYTGMKVEDLRTQYHDDAVNAVKGQLTLESIQKAEGIEVLPEDIDAEVEKMAEQGKRSAEEVRKGLREQDLEYIHNKLMMDRTFKLIKDHANIS